MYVDGREDARHRFGALSVDLDLERIDLLTSLRQNDDDVDGAASADGCGDELHRARVGGGVAPGCAVDLNLTTVVGFGTETNALVEIVGHVYRAQERVMDS